MSVAEIVIPRMNANEDEVIVKEIHVAVGTAVKPGDCVATVESTKAAIEVEAEIAGTVDAILAELGAMADVGAPLLRLRTEGDGPGAGSAGEDAGAATGGAGPGGDVKITAKARLRARELGIDIARVAPVDGRVGVSEVEAAAGHGGDAPTSSAAPAQSGPVRKRSRTAPTLTSLKAVVVGGGGHAATISDLLRAAGWDLVGAVDAKLPKGTQVVSGLEVIGADTDLEEIFASGVRTAFIGVGGATSSETRRGIYEQLLGIGFTLPHLVHPSAHLGEDVVLGPATYVLPQAMIGPRCRLGANVIANASSVVAHDSLIGDHAHLAPGAVLAGTVEVGAGTVVGMGATVLFGCKIGSECLIHNNASVIRDLPDGTELRNP